MSKRTLFTTITPLPAGVSRETAINFLHNHVGMIDLNPLVTERHPIPSPDHAAPEERACIWYSLTDKIEYLPGGLASGAVSYTCAFHDLPRGLQTHCYAPMGLDIRDRWSVAGSLPGEPVEPVELGLGAPSSGLYLREDVEMRCNVLMASFVKKTLKKSHGTLVEALKAKAKAVAAAESHTSLNSQASLTTKQHQQLHQQQQQQQQQQQHAVWQQQQQHERTSSNYGASSVHSHSNSYGGHTDKPASFAPPPGAVEMGGNEYPYPPQNQPHQYPPQNHPQTQYQNNISELE